jgi:hypothetical protein
MSKTMSSICELYGNCVAAVWISKRQRAVDGVSVHVPSLGIDEPENVGADRVRASEPSLR